MPGCPVDRESSGEPTGDRSGSRASPAPRCSALAASSTCGRADRGAWGSLRDLERKLDISTGPGREGELQIQDLRGIATLAYTARRGPWELRGQAGVGVINTELSGYDQSSGEITGSATHPTAEAGLLVGRALDAKWTINAGLLVTVYEQYYPFRGDSMSIERDYDSSFVAGIRRRCS